MEEEYPINDEIDEECRECGEKLPITTDFICGEIICPKCGYVNSFSFDTNCGMYFDP